MQRLTVFESISLDGYFADSEGDMRFAKREVEDPEFDAFVAGNASGGGTLLFGRITYQMMASFWPTPMAAQMMPAVAEGMNAREKVVFSNTLQRADWSNTRVASGDAVARVRELKAGEGAGLVILGSGSLVSQLTQAGLIDEYQFCIVPVVLGRGRTLFPDVDTPRSLTLRSTRSFANGNIFATYERG